MAATDTGATRYLPLHQLITTLVDNGIDATRPDIKAQIEACTVGDSVDLTHILEHPESVICKALTGNLAMKDWKSFKGALTDIFESIKREKVAGAPASYIPILAEANPNWFAASVTTVDGQQFSIGDTDITFSIQSCTKPIAYAVAVEDRSLDYVHRHGPGFEPSGLSFNEVSLNSKGRPHNPYINSGAIATGALVGPGLDAAAKFRHYMSRLSEIAGGTKIAFSHATYLCEQETAWRNNALVAFMQDAGVFPKEVNPAEALDFYLQCCSIEVDTRVSATIAATFAAGGVCPLTGKQVLQPTTVKATTSLMLSCGMYDYSGTWMSTVGLPAKSGVAGLIYVVVPNVMGLAIFSPPLDSHGNSVRGVEFCKRLLKRYPFGIFDQLVGGTRLTLRPGPTTAACAPTAAAGAAGGAAASAAKGARSAATAAAGSGAGGGADDGDDHLSALGGGSVVSLGRSIGTKDPSLVGGASSATKGGARRTSVHVTSPTAAAGGAGSVASSSTGTSRAAAEAAAILTGSAGAAGTRGLVAGPKRTAVQKMDAWLRVFRALVRVHRAFIRIRHWCGLPVTPADLRHLLNAAAADDFAPIELAEPSDRLLKAAAPASSSGAAKSASAAAGAAALERYKEFRATIVPGGGAGDLGAESAFETTLAAAAVIADGSGSVTVTSAALDALLAPTDDAVPAAALRQFLETNGITASKEYPAVYALWTQVLAAATTPFGAASGGAGTKAAASHATPAAAAAAAALEEVTAVIPMRAFFRPGVTQANNILLRAMTSSLAMTNFRSFAEDMLGIYETVKRKVRPGVAGTESGSGTPYTVYKALPIEELNTADPDAFGVSVCTVDGQVLHIGDTGVDFPLMGAIRPLLYSLACKDVGVGEVERWIGVEPTAATADTFSLMHPGGTHGGGGDESHEPVIPDDGYYHPEPTRKAHPRPFNPFLDSGALATSALVGRAHYPSDKRLFHDNGSRFSHLINELQKWAGGRRIGFNNSVFLAQKQKRLKTTAISYYAKGMGVYPEAADPTETANVLYQAEAVQTNTETLAIIAATLANVGVCPLTQERCINSEVMKSTLSLMYNSGLCSFTGNWMFTVGIPSASGVSGAQIVVIPGLMGMAFYSPMLNEFDIPARVVKFCEMLVARYRMNIFDQLVYADKDVAISIKPPTIRQAVTLEQNLLQYELCTAAGAGDVGKVRSLLGDGADPTVADYDLRTALHIACSDGHAAVVALLLEHGAVPTARDRWGSTSIDDARRHGHYSIVAQLEESMSATGLLKGFAAESARSCSSSIVSSPVGGVGDLTATATGGAGASSSGAGATPSRIATPLTRASSSGASAASGSRSRA